LKKSKKPANLYHYGMIEQIPEIIHAVSLMRTQRFKTPLATVSVHHIPPTFYFGFATIGANHIKMATPEKALLGFIYLTPAKNHLFTNLPELEITNNFNYKTCLGWIKIIPSMQRRTMVAKRFAELTKQNYSMCHNRQYSVW
jgi:hypothetical protein